jgi:biopolymer transport protein ExbB
MRTNRVFLIIAIFLIFCGLASDANAWWNEDWQFRRPLNLKPDQAGVPAGVTGLPLLVRLHMGNFDFANAAEGGKDLRIVAGEGQDQQPLKFHIERYDSLEELALVWIKAPNLSQQNVHIYYGNEEAPTGGDEPGTFDVNYVGVYHFNSLEGAPRDSTAYENNSVEFSGGQGLPSVIGNGVSFNGFQDRMVLPTSVSMDFSEGMTFSAWTRVSGPLDNAYLFYADQGDTRLVLGMNGARFFTSLTDGETELIGESPELDAGTWHHVTLTANPGGELVLYVDGQEAFRERMPVSPPLKPENLVIGSSAEPGNYFAGEVDEVRLSKIARPAQWVQAVYASEGPDGTLVGIGQEVAGGGGGGLPVFYLGTIVKNITLDGLVIIGLLTLLALASWLTFMIKARSLFIIGKENKQFREAFNEAEGPLDVDPEKDEFDSSTLYRIYQEGFDALKSRVGNPISQEKLAELSTKALGAFKTSLETGYIQETKRLNAFLLVLTIAVSGGPFLGLLGTVWGVMNTFAAMAEAGEANIMAIAPGVASALSTTVVGLIVAIPALFMYNYLTSRVKELTADTTVFIEQFAVRVEEARQEG